MRHESRSGRGEDRCSLYHSVGPVLSHDASPPSLKFLVSATSSGGAAGRSRQGRGHSALGDCEGVRGACTQVMRGDVRGIDACARLRSHWTPEIDNDVIWIPVRTKMPVEVL